MKQTRLGAIRQKKHKKERGEKKGRILVHMVFKICKRCVRHGLKGKSKNEIERRSRERGPEVASSKWLWLLSIPLVRSPETRRLLSW